MKVDENGKLNAGEIKLQIKTDQGWQDLNCIRNDDLDQSPDLNGISADFMFINEAASYTAEDWDRITRSNNSHPQCKCSVSFDFNGVTDPSTRKVAGYVKADPAFLKLWFNHCKLGHAYNMIRRLRSKINKHGNRSLTYRGYYIRRR